MADDLGPGAGSVDGGIGAARGSDGDAGREVDRPEDGTVDGGIVDEESDESFPASDAPSWWAGEDTEV
jgi:hypothetical protein